MIVSLMWSDDVERAYLYSSKKSQWRGLGLWQQLPPKLMDPWRKNIVAFDVVEERLFCIGSLAVPEKERDQGPSFPPRVCRPSLLTWLLLKDCSEGEWVLRHNVDLQGAPSPLPDDILSFAFHPEDADVLFFNFDDSLYKFNLKTSELQQVIELEVDIFKPRLLYPYLCPQ